MNHLLTRLIATAGFSGLSPVMPGTAGSLVTVILVFGIWSVMKLSLLTLAFFIVAGIFITLVGIFYAGRYSAMIGKEDPGEIVIDEVAGQWLTLTAPLLINFFAEHEVALSISDCAIALLLFRIFDMLKPWPISWFDKNIHGGVGIMLDDVVAGVIAGVGFWIFERLSSISVFTLSS